MLIVLSLLAFQHDLKIFRRLFSPEVTISDDMTGQFSFIQMNKSDDHLAQNYRRVSNQEGVKKNL